MKNLIIILLLIIVLFVLHTINKKTKQRVFISLAPDDNHIQFVEKTIQSLLSQDRMPHKIILNIPKHIQIPHSLYRNQFRDKIKINRCKKNSANNLFLPIMANKKKLGINPEDKILFACDKTLYQKDFINNMCANQKGNTAVINKNVSSHLNPVLIKSMSIHNLDEDIISEEEETRSLSQNIPEEEYAEINKPQIINYNNEIIKNTSDPNLLDVQKKYEMPYDNMDITDLEYNGLLRNTYLENNNNENALDITDYNVIVDSNSDTLLPVPILDNKVNKKYILPDSMYKKTECKHNESCNYTKNQFYNNNSKIDFIPSIKKYTVIKKHLDYNNIETFTVQ